MSWTKGSKSAVLGGTDIKLPGLNAQDSVGEPQAFWVRFIGDAKEWPGVTSVACNEHMAPARPPAVAFNMDPMPAAVLPTKLIISRSLLQACKG